MFIRGQEFLTKCKGTFNYADMEIAASPYPLKYFFNNTVHVFKFKAELNGIVYNEEFPILFLNTTERKYGTYTACEIKESLNFTHYSNISLVCVNKTSTFNISSVEWKFSKTLPIEFEEKNTKVKIPPY